MGGGLAVDVQYDRTSDVRLRVFLAPFTDYDFTPRFEKITTWSQVYGSQDQQRSATLNFRWMNFYSPSWYFFASDNTFSWIFPQGRPFISGTALFESISDDCQFIHLSHFQVYRSWVQLVVIEPVIMWSFFSNAWSEINVPWSGPKKSPSQKTSEVDTNYDCRQGNKWGHQLGCKFQSSRYVNLCLKGALINYLQPLWCGWNTLA